MGQVIDPNSLLIKTDQQPATVAFFNNLISQLCFAMNGIGVRMDGYDAAEQNLVNLGLANINSTLGPFLSTLQQAAHLGFLVAEADGRSLSLTVGQPFDMILTSNGASLFTPTKWLMVMDVNDSTNWGVLQLDSWVMQDLNLAAHCIYASKTLASSSWQVTCGSGVLNAMVNDLTAANTAAANAVNAANSAQTNANYVQSVANVISSSGNVISVAGKAGVVNLVESDIANLAADLAARPTTVYVNNAVTGLQSHSANLDQLASTSLTSFGLALFTAANAAAAMTTLGAAPLGSPLFTGAPKAPTPTVGDNSANLATTAFVASAFAPLASPALTGTPTAPTTSPGDSTTKLATTAFVSAAVGATPVPTKASSATVATGTDDTQFVTALGIANNYPSKSAVFNVQSGTSYTLQASDNGKVVSFTNGSAVTVTLPNSLPANFNCTLEQRGAGQVGVTPASGATLHTSSSRTGLLTGQYSAATVWVWSNSGTNAVYNMVGDYT